MFIMLHPPRLVTLTSCHPSRLVIPPPPLLRAPSYHSSCTLLLTFTYYLIANVEKT
jgi:hypothetical protein